MTIRRLEDFARSIGIAFGLAHKQTRGGAEAQVTSMDVDLAATLERIGPKEAAAAGGMAEAGAFALRIGRPKLQTIDRDGNLLRLSIGVRDANGEQVEVRLEGKLLSRYGRTINADTMQQGEKTTDGETL